MQSLVKQLDGRPVTLITTGNTPQAVLQQETNVKNIEKAIQDLHVTYETAQMNKALDVAQAFVGDTQTSIYVFTDSLDKKQLPMEKDSVKWLVYGAEKGLTNVAITRFAATTDGKSTMALVQLQNDTDQKHELTITLQNNQGEVIMDEKISLSANEATTKTFKDLPLMDTITANIDVKDDYAVDNTQSVVLQTATANIVVDQSMHQLIQKGFQSINNNVKIVPSLQLADNQNATIVTNQTSLLQKIQRPLVLIGRDDVEKRKLMVR